MCITADPPRTLTLSDIIKKYANSGMLYLDVIATIPSIIFLTQRKLHIAVYFNALRYSHASQFFYPV